ncbi:MAG: contractile injection system protein, VgrG/Pvc8 family [Gemmatimonadaceae bacterium]
MTPNVILFPGSGSGITAVQAVAWRVAIDGKDVTRDITPMVTSVSYSDRIHGEVDDVELVVEDSQGRWRGDWYPTKGDKLELWIGHAGEALLPCGQFQIDELEPAGPPSTLTMRAVAAGIIPALRTKRSKAYEEQSLRAIAESIAARHQYRLVGTIEDIRVERMTQREETDLSFLTRVAEAYGYVFTVRGDQLIFYSVVQLEDADTVATIRRTDVTEYRFKDKAHQLYRACTVMYEDAKTKQTIKRTATAEGIVSGDVKKITDFRAENVQQADAHARAQLRQLNSRETTGTLALPGNPRLVSGTNATLVGWAKLDGKYTVEEAVHRATRQTGYVTALEVKRVAA